MIAVKMTGKNFMSFDEIDMSLQNRGKVLVLGENRKTPACTANMAGKTALFELLPWIFYGTTPRGVSGDEIIKYGRKHAEGSAFLIKQNKEIEVTRYRKHKEFGNKVLIKEDGNLVLTDNPQEYIHKLIGMDSEAFYHAAFFPQEIRSFFISMTDAKQKSVLDTLLGLTNLDKALACTKTKIKAEETKRKNLLNDVLKTETLIGERERNVTAETATLALLADEAALIQDSTATLTKAAEFEISVMEKEVVALEARKEEIKKETLQRGEQRLKDQGEALHREIENNRLQEKTLTRELAVAETERKHLAGQLEQLKSNLTIGSECPTCNQLITIAAKEVIDKTTAAERQSLQEQIAKLDADITSHTSDLAENKEILTLLNAKDRALDKQVKNLNEIYEVQVTEVQQRIATLNDKIYEKRKDSELQAAQTTGLQQKLEESKARLKDLLQLKRQEEIKLVGLNAELADSSKRLERLIFWEKGFGNSGIKSYAIDPAVPIFNEAANKCCRILTDGALRIEAKTTSQLKNKEEREKFCVNIIDTSNGNKEIPFEAYSGGYKRRPAIGGMFGLQAIVRNRLDSNFNIVVLDEPIENMDQAGIERFMDVLTELNKEIESIFFISHSQEYIPYFNNVIRVVHDATGSHVIE